MLKSQSCTFTILIQKYKFLFQNKTHYNNNQIIQNSPTRLAAQIATKYLNYSKLSQGQWMFAKNKNKFKREDFLFENGWFDTHVKKPGTLHMQPFQISDCQDTSLYIFDSNGGVYIDDCKHCTIFIGPSQSSVFVRDCHYMNIVCITQQFRVRDSTNCRFWIWCESQPIIESSYNLTFSSYPSQCTYQLLLEQMKEAKLHLWNNNWFDIYDFTPMKYSKVNYQNVERLPTDEKILKKIKNKIKQENLQQKGQVIPLCIGKQQNSNYIVLVISPIPNRSLNLKMIHSRVGKVTQQLKSFINESLINSECLFVKIRDEDEGLWRKISKEAKIMGIIKQQKGKQLIEGIVFVPFADQR